jgi:hypothetical protein
MQISRITKTELALLIAGLRCIHVSDAEATRKKLALQLENEMATRFGVMVGSENEQERNIK